MVDDRPVILFQLLSQNNRYNRNFYSNKERLNKAIVI